jgi:hypothetical protein
MITEGPTRVVESVGRRGDAISEVMECLAAHAGYTTYTTPVTERRLLVKLPLCQTRV